MVVRPSVVFLSSATHPLEHEHAASRRVKGLRIDFSHETVDADREDLAHTLFGMLQEHHALVVRDPRISSDLKALIRDIRGLTESEREREELAHVPTVVHLDEIKDGPAATAILSTTFRGLEARFRNESRHPHGRA
ncbi:hypothetical protein HYV43_00025 [Candidatus Micrarchaeota archaeon]|nr:hypothetical protein [Candidatus Micrarchaeota archaeon]